MFHVAFWSLNGGSLSRWGRVEGWAHLGTLFGQSVDPWALQYHRASASWQVLIYGGFHSHRGTPDPDNWIFNSKPNCLGIPHLWKPPYVCAWVCRLVLSKNPSVCPKITIPFAARSALTNHEFIRTSVLLPSAALAG